MPAIIRPKKAITKYLKKELIFVLVNIPKIVIQANIPQLIKKMLVIEESLNTTKIAERDIPFTIEYKINSIEAVVTEIFSITAVMNHTSATSKTNIPITTYFVFQTRLIKASFLEMMNAVAPLKKSARVIHA